VLRANWKLLALIALITWGAYSHWQQRPVLRGPGITASTQPDQRAPTTSAALTLNGYQIVPLADFSIEARVLSTKHYKIGREADLAPVDLALGWGHMSDEAVLARIEISQSGRFYFWRTDEFPIPREEIETHSANMHMVPADQLIERQLEQVRPGQVVTISGQLIEAQASDGWRWRSSLTREDTGNGACELVLVRSLVVINKN
jgi:hypothetical protein